MEYPSKKTEASRANVRKQEKRIENQRKRLEQALADRDPADELQARLLIMEQSLISMTRFLRILERDLTAELSLHKHETQNRIKAQDTATAPDPAPVPRAQPVPFETIAKAMRKQTER